MCIQISGGKMWKMSKSSSLSKGTPVFATLWQCGGVAAGWVEAGILGLTLTHRTESWQPTITHKSVATALQLLGVCIPWSNPVKVMFPIGRHDSFPVYNFTTKVSWVKVLKVLLP